jgi:hypothetical protein
LKTQNGLFEAPGGKFVVTPGGKFVEAPGGRFVVTPGGSLLLTPGAILGLLETPGLLVSGAAGKTNHPVPMTDVSTTNPAKAFIEIFMMKYRPHYHARQTELMKEEFAINQNEINRHFSF